MLSAFEPGLPAPSLLGGFHQKRHQILFSFVNNLFAPSNFHRGFPIYKGLQNQKITGKHG